MLNFNKVYGILLFTGANHEGYGFFDFCSKARGRVERLMSCWCFSPHFSSVQVRRKRGELQMDEYSVSRYLLTNNNLD